uniref:Viral A-type inclusion protein n=1 Tax=Rhabditophanes sp. KR3021 TaxID=114890 RepID=A0AC35TS47_9BILA
MDEHIIQCIADKTKMEQKLTFLDRNLLDHLTFLMKENKTLKEERDHLKRQTSHSESLLNSDGFCKVENVSNLYVTASNGDIDDFTSKKKCVINRLGSMSELCNKMFVRLRGVAVLIKDLLHDDDSEVIGDFVLCMKTAQFEINSSLHEATMLISEEIEVHRMDTSATNENKLPSDISFTNDSVMVTHDDREGAAAQLELKKKIAELERDRDFFKTYYDAHTKDDVSINSSSSSIIDVTDDYKTENSHEFTDDNISLTLTQIGKLVDNITNYCDKKVKDAEQPMKTTLENIKSVSTKTAKKIDIFKDMIDKAMPIAQKSSRQSSRTSLNKVGLTPETPSGGEAKRNSKYSIPKDLRQKMVKEINAIQETMIYINEATTELYSRQKTNHIKEEIKNKPRNSKTE